MKNMTPAQRKKRDFDKLYNSPLDQMRKKDTAKRRAAAQNSKTTTKTIPNKKKKPSFLRSLGFGS